VPFSLAFRHALAHDAGMVVLSFSDEARALIDPVVVPQGFASGQGDGVQVIFCASLDELAARFPRLPQVGKQQRGSGACVDLVLTAGDQTSLATVQLEGMSLDETLRRVGLAGRADELRAAIHGDRTHALSGVAAALRELLAASE
jgi:hypothetical protein